MKGRGGVGFARATAWVVMVAAGVGAATLCLTEPSGVRHVYAQQSDSGYADPPSCVKCHGDVAATYAKTGMGRSFHRVRAADAAEFEKNVALYNRSSDRHYAMVERDGKLYEQRHQVGFDGQVTNEQEMQVDYVMGSGNHAKTYLHRTAEGKLIELPVSWYSEMGGYFEMSPGYDLPKQQDFRRTANYECMSCHNAYPSVDKTMLESPDQDIYGAEMPEGIDCQRCHGPGQKHVRLASTEGSSEVAIRGAIVNPEKLTRARQMDVCMQCHLETTSSQLPHSIPNFERAAFSYRPGEPLADYELTFDHKPGVGEADRFEVAHEGYRLRKSTCFLKSQMTCLTCHDPHNVPRGAEATQHYVAVCSSCHVKVHAAGVPGVSAIDAAKENCLTCHMWKRRSEDAVHIVMTDHYIQRIKPKRDLLKPFEEVTDLPYRDEVMPYYPKALAQVADGELYLGAAQIEDGSNLQAGTAQLRRAIEVSKPKNAAFYFNLGVAYSKMGKNAEAVPWFEEAVRRREDYPQAERALAAALAGSGNFERAAEVGEKAAAAYPDTTTLTNLGNVYLRLGRVEDAKRVLEKALAMNADLPDANFFLGLAATRERDLAAAEKFYRAAISDEPDFAGPQNNLAGILARQGKVEEAIFHCEKAIEGNPLDAQAYRNYGLLLANTGLLDKAVVELKEAVRLDEKSAQLHVDLGNVYAGRGEQAAAEEQLRMAIGLDKENGMANLELGQLLTQEGKAAEARSYYEVAKRSSDARVREAAIEALQR